MISSQEHLPFPSDGAYAKVKLQVPTGRLLVDELRLELIGQAEGQGILNEIWKLPESASPGDEIALEYRVTDGKQFHCRAYLSSTPDRMLDLVTENPLVNVLNPHSIRIKIEESEELLRTKGGGSSDDRDTFVQIARWYAELNQREKALDFLRTALLKTQRPDAEILILQGIYYQELGDYERSEKAYREADRATATWGSPLFNLSLSLRKRGMHGKLLIPSIRR